MSNRKTVDVKYQVSGLRLGSGIALDRCLDVVLLESE